MTPTLLLRLLCAVAGVGAYLSASGLLRLHEVFSSASASASPSVERHEDNPQQQQQQQHSDLQDVAYDRLIVVLIDALRADMVLGSAAMHSDSVGDLQERRAELNVHMPFTSALVTSGRALGYVAHASVPTVTMPRVKALVTGKAPVFIDILKNFNSRALDDTDANLVSLLAARGKRLVLYGDDTWLKLFPRAFARADGTSGFYTRDTVDVDNNVTRHLVEELDPTMQHAKSNDWDALVLHYLGLDHVGHLRGPRSKLMQEKMQEMDRVVQLIVDSVREQDARRRTNDSASRPSLIVVCSDHGMSEVGNHGGATLDESSALLMFMRGDGESMVAATDFPYKQQRNQVDLVPTISLLFGLPIPIHSTGLLLDDVVRASSGSVMRHSSYYMRALYRNFQQLYALAKTKFSASALASFDRQYEVPLRELRRSLQAEEKDFDTSHQTASMVLRACEMLQATVMQSDGSEYNVAATFCGLLLLFASSAAAMATLVMHYKVKARSWMKEGASSHLVAIVGMGSILQIASLSSSSSIENEHATAFFMTTSLLIIVAVLLLRQDNATTNFSRPRAAVAIVGLLLIVTRMLRARNQIINFWRLNGLVIDPNLPGNEFANDDSVSILSTAPMLPSNVLPLGVCIAFVCGVVLRKAARHTMRALQTGALSDVVVSACSALLFVAGMLACLNVKELTNRNVVDETGSRMWTWWVPLDADASARMVYASIASISVFAVLAARTLRRSLMEMVVWLLVSLLQRDANYPTLCLLCLQLELVAKLLEHEQGRVIRHSGIGVASLASWLSQAAFFALGNSHLVTTIDISQSYHGVSSYSQSLVGTLTFVSVFSGPLLCFVSLAQWLDIDAPVKTMTPSREMPRPNAPLSVDTRWTACAALFIYQTLRFAVYSVVVYCMRFHLFIWSVFAPKV
ncbi:unnamed protein product [Hyaloperonospora brassicae]|uniref:GPI ethanolamine phosphate transferase 2 C-terminal domain-containing protein n=1 Tax=Hyaloperonospora brassicae TaxID=162125 RepID=A0AAV0UMN8_HYABA|nr:unnamed protein product [Hyaloperonospora brassicae]